MGPAALLPAVPHSATVEHKGTEVIPGEVSVGAPIATVGYGLPLWGRKKREAEAEAEADPEADPEAWLWILWILWWILWTSLWIWILWTSLRIWVWILWLRSITI